MSSYDILLSILSTLHWRVHLIVRHCLIYAVNWPSGHHKYVGPLLFPSSLCDWPWTKKASSEPKESRIERVDSADMRSSKTLNVGTNVEYMVGRGLWYQGRLWKENYSFPSYIAFSKRVVPTFVKASLTEVLNRVGPINRLTLHVTMDASFPYSLPRLNNYSVKHVHVLIYEGTDSPFLTDFKRISDRWNSSGLKVTITEKSTKWTWEVVPSTPLLQGVMGRQIENAIETDGPPFYEGPDFAPSVL